MKTEVLITGASGFVGYNLCRHFTDKEYNVIGWDNAIENKGDSGNWKRERRNLLNYNEIIEGLSGINPDLIIHCAGLADVGKSINDPSLDYLLNVTITHNLLFALQEVGIRNVRFIFLSSAAVYGDPSVLPINEGASLNPLSPYALHKIMCEDMCRYFHKRKVIDVKILRIFSAYGVGLKKQIFWDMCQRYKKYGKLTMYGTGEESRDYINIVDLVRVIELIAFHAPKDDTVYNVANGTEVTISEVARHFADLVKIDYDDIKFDGVRIEGIPVNWRADISKLIALGYTPTVKIHDGIEMYIQWANEELKI